MKRVADSLERAITGAHARMEARGYDDPTSDDYRYEAYVYKAPRERFLQLLTEAAIIEVVEK